MHRLPRALALRQQSRYPTAAFRRSPHALRTPRRHHPPPQQQRRWKSHVIYRPTGEAMRMQAVRFKRPGFFSMRRLFTFGLYTGAIYAYFTLLWRQLDVEIEFIEDEDEEHLSHHHQQQDAQQQQQEDDDDEIDDNDPLYADEESTFIPLTWSTKLPRTFYRGSDPEWQEFIRIAKDSARHKRIQDELVQIVYTGCVQHPTIARQLGPNPQIGKYWLDISFPDGPPQEFERRGIEIGEGFIAWSTQKVDAEKQWRVERALLPKAAAEGVWKTVTVLAGIQWRRVKQRLGWEGVDPLSPEERYRMAVEMQQQRQQSGHKSGEGREVGKKAATAQTEPDAVVGSAVSSTSSSSSSSATASPTTQPQQQQPQQPSRSSSSSSERKDLPWHIPTVPLPIASSSSTSASSSPNATSSSSTSAIPSDLPIAMHVFSHALSKSWNPKKSEPPRGAFVVQGLVEVRGSKGRMLFDVQSAYDPKAAPGGKFVSVNAGVRGYKRWRQSPRGGP